MSRNFALLHRAGKQTLLTVPSPIDSPPPHDGEMDHLQDIPPGEDASKPEKEGLLPQQTSDSLSSQSEPRPAEGRLGINKEAAQPKAEAPRVRFEREILPHSRPALHLSKAAHEQVVKLVQRVFVIPNSLGPRMVVFSSVDKGNESSEICCHAGDVLATHMSGSVCLVDANLRAPLLHRLLGVDRSPGLADAASGSGPIRDFAVRIGDGNVWVVPPGSQAAEIPGLFSSPQWHLRIEELKETFDYVLIDAPPVNYEADAVLLGQRAEGVILVLEAHSTRREAARKAKETLQSSNVKLLGAILNNRTFPVPEAIYRKL